jgi:predicted transposase/invertase (TIGR01784 family)
MYITTRSIYMKKDLTAEEARRTISPTSDLFARWLFSAPNHENLTKSFINAVLEDAGHEQIASVRILSPFNLAESIRLKETVLDMKVSDQSGQQYDVEIQTTTNEVFWKRLTYYNNAMYNSQLRSSGRYDQLGSTTVIALLREHIYAMDRKVQPEDKLHHCSLVVHEDDHDGLFYPNGDPEKFHIIELDRFALNADALYTVHGSEKRKLAPSLFRWLRFFVEGAKEDFVEKYEETDIAVKEAKEDYEKFLSDEQLREAQFQHEMFLHDQAQARSDARKDGYNQGRQAGRKEGLQQGMAGYAAGRRQENALAVARNMKKDGMPSEKIAAYTGLSPEEIEKL